MNRSAKGARNERRSRLVLYTTRCDRSPREERGRTVRVGRTLEVQLQTELDDAGGAGAGDHAIVIAPDIAAGFAEVRGVG